MLQKPTSKTLAPAIACLAIALSLLVSTPVAANDDADGFRAPASRLEDHQAKSPTELTGTSDVVLQGSLCAGSGCSTSGAHLFVTDDGKVGVGTAAPSQKFEVAGGDLRVAKSTGGLTSFFLENTGGGLNSSWIFRANGNNGALTLTEAGGTSPFRILSGAASNAFTVNSTGVSITGSLVVNGVTMTVPDYVFEPTYELLPLDQQGEFMSTHKHLPAVGGATYDSEGRAVVDLGAHQMGMLEELEKAHLYIQQLNAKIAEKDARIDTLETRLTRLEAAVE